MPRNPPGDARVTPLRILLVSQMYPGPADPDLGVFVANLERELTARGHELERAVVDRRHGGRRRHLALARDSLRAARRFRPDVVYAHFLVPAGLFAALTSRAPLVVTAHGQDVANIGTLPGTRAATRFVVDRAATIVVVSDWLRAALSAAVPSAAGKTEVIDCGVDRERFAPDDQAAARDRVGWNRTARRSSALEASRSARTSFGSPGRSRATVRAHWPSSGTARCDRTRRAPWSAPRRACPPRRRPRLDRGSDVVCQPSLEEPFGLASLEAMASGRSVVATNVGGPPQFVTPEAGVLVDPTDEDALVAALASAAALPRPNLAGREASAEHDVRLQAERVEAILERAARGRRA